MVALNLSKPESGSQVPKVGRLPWRSGETMVCRGDKWVPMKAPPVAQARHEGTGRDGGCCHLNALLQVQSQPKGLWTSENLKGGRAKGKRARTP